jgi:hypothetical protein
LTVAAALAPQRVLMSDAWQARGHDTLVATDANATLANQLHPLLMAAARDVLRRLYPGARVD